jgi:blue light- and temperature-responsive anti-repressor
VGAALYHLAYVSQSCAQPDRTPHGDLRDILATSRARNRLAGITGALTLGGGTFGQILEGPPDAVEAAFERIERDPRHRDVVLLDLAPIARRSFGGWAMAFVASCGLTRLDEVAQPGGFTAAVLAGERLHALLWEELRSRNKALRREPRHRSVPPDKAFRSGS